MIPLNVTDQLFLLMERRQQPMHIGTLMLFSYPDDAGPNYSTEVFDYLRSFSEPKGPSHLKLVQKWGRYYWGKDYEFDIEHHVRHSALPKPGRIRELLAHVSAEHSNLMHRERPLWEIHFIEGIEGGRFAIYMKAHHAVVDGASGNKALQKFLSEDKNLRGSPPIWAMESEIESTMSREEDIGLDVVKAMPQEAMQKVRSLPTAINNIKKGFVVGAKKENSLFGLNAPKTILNTRITGSRRYAAQSYDFSRFRKISSHFNATINDVVLAVCGSALRQYLISQNALPEKPLVAMVPVSMREKDDSITFGNKIAMLQASLGTHIDDAETRMLSIKKSVANAKDKISHMSKEEYILYGAMALAPGSFHLATGLFPGWLPCNVMISNVPGPENAMYWNGAKMEGIYPISLPIDRAALNITMMSYNGQIDFGLTACRRSMPSMQRLLDYIEEALFDLENIVSPPSCKDSFSSEHDRAVELV